LGFVACQIIQGIINVVKIPAEKAFPLKIPRRDDSLLRSTDSKDGVQDLPIIAGED
jgi:hypothetical protein